MMMLLSVLLPFNVSVEDPFFTNEAPPEIDPEKVKLADDSTVSDWLDWMMISPPVVPPPEMLPMVSEVAI